MKKFSDPIHQFKNIEPLFTTGPYRQSNHRLHHILFPYMFLSVAVYPLILMIGPRVAGAAARSRGVYSHGRISYSSSASTIRRTAGREGHEVLSRLILLALLMCFHLRFETSWGHFPYTFTISSTSCHRDAGSAP